MADYETLTDKQQHNYKQIKISKTFEVEQQHTTFVAAATAQPYD